MLEVSYILNYVDEKEAERGVAKNSKSKKEKLRRVRFEEGADAPASTESLSFHRQQLGQVEFRQPWHRPWRP